MAAICVASVEVAGERRRTTPACTPRCASGVGRSDAPKRARSAAAAGQGRAGRAVDARPAVYHVGAPCASVRGGSDRRSRLRSVSYCITNRFVIECRASCRQRPKPTAAELEILGALWRRGPSTVHEVQPELARGSRVGYTTVLKLLQIMFEKGLVTRNESSRPHVFKAAVAEARSRGAWLRICSIRCSTARR